MTLHDHRLRSCSAGDATGIVFHGHVVGSDTAQLQKDTYARLKAVYCDTLSVVRAYPADRNKMRLCIEAPISYRLSIENVLRAWYNAGGEVGYPDGTILSWWASDFCEFIRMEPADDADLATCATCRETLVADPTAATGWHHKVPALHGPVPIRRIEGEYVRS